ncbi:Putative mariner length, partial [Caligus rogercresseyi]
IESAGDCGSHRHITWVSGFDFERSLGYEKAICKMGAAFAHLQDNARVHTCVVSMAIFYELRYELLPHLPYSPDLAPSDYFLFPNLKKWLTGKRFYSNNEIISQTNTYFEDLEKSYFLEGIKKLEKRWTKCIEFKGDYVEK